ncbi:MAG: DUF59 domain-containing protein [Parcubacteria group bacterium]|nr:DUF59 domain-containing protein [Parcubacteria group bacterium]
MKKSQKRTQREEVIEVMKQVLDPELKIDLWTLGLVYDISVVKNTLRVIMTYTTPLCPFGSIMVSELKEKLSTLGFASVTIDVVFEPPWKPSDELRALLGV